MTETIEKKFDIKHDVEKNKASQLNCKLISETKIELTIEKAEELLSYATFKAERDVTETHIQEIYDEMAAGRFRPEHVKVAIATLGDVVYRVNGQHTAWARTYMPKNYPCQVSYLEYEVPNEEELRKLYGVFDPAWSARSKGHVTKVLLANAEAAEGVSMADLGKLSAGFKFWHWDTRDARKRAGPNELANVVNKTYPDLFNNVALFVSAYTETTFMKRQGVIAAVFECFDRKPSLAEEFWKPVADGLNLNEKTDARYALRRWLFDHSQNAGSNYRDKASQTNPEEVYRICISAWNRWRDGDKVQGLRITNKRVRAK